MKLETPHGSVHICGSKDELGRKSASHFIALCNAAIKKNGRCTVGLSGGSTPPVLYHALLLPENRKQVDWNNVHFFVSDERCVAHDDKDSNWGLAMREFLGQLNLPAENLHPTHEQDKDPEACALHYEQLIREFFGTTDGEVPRFDILQLGMGPDGHTASLFPGTKALSVDDRLVTANFVNKFETYRITFTFRLINNAANVLFMLQGEEKSHVLADALNSEGAHYPVQRVMPASGKVEWYVDEPAARDLMATARK